ncbi:Uncharacterized protein PECH_008169 [Penicillium ucsense]|uniref:Uncharacterized protein n=1 Tax=Penicillium ucsense TaxID=2839758 RepID=A0A8J8WG55_9EURO|nr:Uncharacterized protein PECM_000598 [Penicillium ucsense]KAF7734373.1 Uncharacterized protein PECH_008169 [Penicillium ucsense]
MLSRGCSCLRRPLSAALDALAASPDEPLLFLYPRWAASAVRRRRPLSTVPRTSPLRLETRIPCSAKLHANSGGNKGSRHLSARGIAHHTASSRIEADPNDLADDTKSEDGQRSDIQGKLGSPTLIRTQANPESPEPPSSQLSRVVERAGKKPKRQEFLESDPWPMTPGSRVRVPKNLWERNLSPRNRKQIRYGEFILANENRGGIPPDSKTWLDMRDLLNSIQRQVKGVNRRGTKFKEMLVPEETVALLAGATTPGKAAEENMWHLPVRHGCLVQVLPAEKGDGIYRKMVLHGSEGTLEAVEEMVKRQQERQAKGDPLVEIQKPPIPIVASTQKLRKLKRPVPLVRAVWTTPHDDQQPLDITKVMEQSSTISSVKDFADHIEDLTSAKMTHPVRAARLEGPTAIPPPRRVAEHIGRLFRRDSLRKYLSTAALNNALRFLYKYEFLHIARDVFGAAEYLATVDSYNVLLRSAALRQDRRMFEFFLQAMAKRRISPNSDTWLVLLQAMLTQKSKAAIIKEMAKKGYMKDINTTRSTLQLTISDSFFVHLEGGQDVYSFFELMVKTNGADWFTASLLSQMLNVTVRLKNYSAMQELLDICDKYRLDMNNSCLMQVLHMTSDDIFTALEHTLKIMKRSSFKLNREAMSKLFSIAFNGFHYNLCRVLWHYACLQDLVTQDMRNLVLDSLVRNASLETSSDDIRKIWHVCAGKVVIRRDSRARFRIQPEYLQRLPSEFHENPFLYLVSGYKSLGPERALQLQLAKIFVNRDVLTNSRPKFPLPLMLEAAAVMDQEWRGKPWPLAWMLQNSIGIPTTRQI